MSDYRDKHVRDVVFSVRERSIMAKKITACILGNYSRKDILKMYFLLKNGHDISFSTSPVRIQGLERDLPGELQKILQDKYPTQAENSDIDAA